MESYIEKGTKKYWRAVCAMFSGSIAVFGGEYCLQPILPSLSRTFNITPIETSLAMSFGTVGMAITMIVIAVVSQKLPRKKSMAGALIASAILVIAMSMTNNFWLLLLFRFVQGCFLAFFPTLIISYINDEFSKGIIGLVVGIYISGTAIGGLVGRIGTSFLTDWLSWRSGVGVMGLCYLLLGFIFYIGLPTETTKLSGSKIDKKIFINFKNSLTNKKLLAVNFVAFAILGAFVAVFNYITYDLIAPPYNLSQSLVSCLFVLYLLGSISSTAMGALADKIGNYKAVIWSLIIMICGSFITTGVYLWVKILGLGIFTIGFFASHATACGWLGKIATGDKAKAVAMYMLFYYLGATVLGTVAGYFLLQWGWLGLIVFINLILFSAMIKIMITFKGFELE